MTEPSPTPGSPDGLLEIGYIGKAFGLHGEVIVALSTNRTDRLGAGESLTLRDGRTLTVVESHAHQHRFRVRFDGVAGRNAAEALRGETLFAAPIDDPDELWVHDLIGRRVVTIAGEDVGECTAVVDNPVHDQLELDTGFLVPVVFVTEIDDVGVRIDPPDGLFEL